MSAAGQCSSLPVYLAGVRLLAKGCRMLRPELQEERIRISGPMVDALERLPSLRGRFESVELGHPLIGSKEFADRRVEYGGDRPGSEASIRLSLALDHLWTYRRMLVG